MPFRMAEEPSGATEEVTSPAPANPGTSSAGPPPGAPVSTPARPRRPPQWAYAVVVVVVLVIVLLLVLVPGGFLHRSSPASGPTTTTLAQSGWSATSLPYGQFGDITFMATSTELINGSFITANTIDAYVMNDTDFKPLVTKDVVVGYQYTTGTVWQGWINDTVTAGGWHIVFLNTNYYTASGVAVEQPITLTPV